MARIFLGGRWCIPPPPGISGSAYAMKFKLTPGMALDERSWFMTYSAMSRDSFVYYRPKKHYKSTSDEIINQLLWSRRLPRVSFNLIACLEPVKKDGHYFHAKILVCKFHLGSKRACSRTRRRLCFQIFLCQNVSKEILFTGAKYHAKPSRGSRVT